jgi:hypothetical protein
VIRATGILLAALTVAAVATLSARDEHEPRAETALLPDWPVLSARDDWVRTAADKLAAAAVGGCNVSSGAGDLDGDRAADAVLTYSRRERCGAADQVAVFLSDGAARTGPIEGEIDAKTGLTCPSGCVVFAVSDLNADGRAEVVLELSHGASQARLGAYRLGARGLARLPIALSYYGSVCCGGHVSCRGRDKVVVSGYGRDILGSVWVGETVYRFDGRRFVPISARWEQRAAFDARGTRVPGRDCIEPRPVRNAEAELLQLVRGDL